MEKSLKELEPSVHNMEISSEKKTMAHFKNRA
jgi:hypothetical protein